MCASRLCVQICNSPTPSPPPLCVGAPHSLKTFARVKDFSYPVQISQHLQDGLALNAGQALMLPRSKVSYGLCWAIWPPMRSTFVVLNGTIAERIGLKFMFSNTWFMTCNTDIPISVSWTLCSVLVCMLTLHVHILTKQSTTVQSHRASSKAADNLCYSSAWLWGQSLRHSLLHCDSRVFTPTSRDAIQSSYKHFCLQMWWDNMSYKLLCFSVNLSSCCGPAVIRVFVSGEV